MSATSPDAVELLLRTGRRSLFGVLAVVLITGTTILAHAIRPGALIGEWPARAPWMIPVAIALVAGLMATGRRRTDADAVAAVAEDEFRRTNLAQAEKYAFVTVMAAQVPLSALALAAIPAWSAVTIMAVSTVMIGIVTLIATFLFLDRE